VTWSEACAPGVTPKEKNGRSEDPTDAVGPIPKVTVGDFVLGVVDVPPVSETLGDGAGDVVAATAWTVEPRSAPAASKVAVTT
jgi:hypothetical protein